MTLGNDLLQEALVRLPSHLLLYRLYYATGTRVETLSEQEKIVGALASGRPSDARVALAEHIKRSRERLAPGAGDAKPAASKTRTDRRRANAG